MLRDLGAVLHLGALIGLRHQVNHWVVDSVQRFTGGAGQGDSIGSRVHIDHPPHVGDDRANFWLRLEPLLDEAPESIRASERQRPVHRYPEHDPFALRLHPYCVHAIPLTRGLYPELGGLPVAKIHELRALTAPNTINEEESCSQTMVTTDEEKSA